MGHYRHFILSFLVGYALSSFSAATDVYIVGSSTSFSVHDEASSLIYQAIGNSEGSSSGNVPLRYRVKWISDRLENITKLTFTQFNDDYVPTGQLKVYDKGAIDSLSQVKNEISKSIDTNQFYLAAILAELRKNKTPFYESSFLNDSLVRGNSLSDIYFDIWYNATNSYWQILARDYGLWQAIALQPFFDYDMSQLEGRAIFNENQAKEKWPFLSTFRKIFGSGSVHDASASQIDSFFSGGLGQLKMKYYGTYPTYLAVSSLAEVATNLLVVATNEVPSAFLSSSYFSEDDQGNVYVNTNSSFFAFADRVNSNALAGVTTSYDGPSNAVWDVGEDTEVGERFSSLFSVTNLLSSINETFVDLTDNLNEPSDSMKESLRSLKGGSRVFTIDYHPNFWIQGMTEAPTQTITVTADKVLSPDVLVIIEFVKTFALFGGSLILGITTFYSVMKENPLWFN